MPITRINRAADDRVSRARKICLWTDLAGIAAMRGLVVPKDPEGRDICIHLFRAEKFFILVALGHVTGVYDAACFAYDPGNIVIAMVCDDDDAVGSLQQFTP